MNQNSMTASVDHNVSNLLAEVAKRLPDRKALIFQSKGQTDEITFAELWEQAGAVGNALISKGLKPGDRVVIMIPMSIDLYVTLLATIKIGAAAVFVDPWIPAKQIARFSDFASPRAFIGIGKSHFLRLFRKRLRSLPITVTNGRKFLSFPAKYRLSDLKNYSRDDTVAPVLPEDSALITFTSGSSGEPKGANRTHQFLGAQHRALSHEFPYDDSDVDMPMFPVFALNNLVTGLTSVVPEMDFRKVAQVDGAVIAKQMIQYRVTTVTASPPLLDRVAEHLQTSNGDKPKLRRVLTGGAPVTDIQLDRWIKSYGNAELIVAYGSTEAEPVGHISAQSRLELAGTNPGYCTGKTTELIQKCLIPISQGPVKDPANLFEHNTAPGEIGELIVAGDHVCRDYYNNESATAENKLIDSNGVLWHRMGDTGYFDDEERFWLVGRVHSTIKRNGIFEHPQLIEQAALRASAKIEQVAAIGFDHRELGQQVVVVVYWPNLQPANAEQKVKEEIQSAGYPCDQVQFSDSSLPVDPRHNTKIDYGKTKAMFLDRITLS